MARQNIIGKKIYKNADSSVRFSPAPVLRVSRPDEMFPEGATVGVGVGEVTALLSVGGMAGALVEGFLEGATDDGFAVGVEVGTLDEGRTVGT